MKSKLSSEQKKMSEEMILYFHNYKHYYAIDEPEYAEGFYRSYLTEKSRLESSLRTVVEIRGEDRPIYRVVDLATGKTIYFEGDR